MQPVQDQLAQMTAQQAQSNQLQETMLQQMMQQHGQEQQQLQLIMQQQSQQQQLLMQQQLTLLQSLRPHAPMPAPFDDAHANVATANGQPRRGRRLGRRERLHQQDQARLQRGAGSESEHAELDAAAPVGGQLGKALQVSAPPAIGGEAQGSGMLQAMEKTTASEAKAPEESDTSGGAIEAGWTCLEKGHLHAGNSASVLAAASVAIGSQAGSVGAVHQCSLTNAEEEPLTALVMTLSTSLEKLHEVNTCLLARVAALEGAMSPNGTQAAVIKMQDLETGESGAVPSDRTDVPDPEGAHDSSVAASPESEGTLPGQAADAPSPATVASCPPVDPLPIGILFPGCGSAYVKMLSGVNHFPRVREMLDTARSILGFDVMQLCLEGPESALHEPSKCNPVMFIAGLAGLEKLRLEREEAVTRPKAIAGLGVGEITALCAAGVLSFEDGLGLAKLRGEVLSEAWREAEQAMLTVGGLEKSTVIEICQSASGSEDEAVWRICTELCPKGMIVGGLKPAILKIEQLCVQAGCLQAKILRSGGGSVYSSLTKPALDRMEKAITDLVPKLMSPQISVYLANTDSQISPGTHPEVIAAMLQHQLTSPVLWEQTVKKLIADGVSEFYEVGPMKQLKIIMNHIDSRIWASTFNCEV